MTKALQRLKQLESLGAYPHDESHTMSIVKTLRDAVNAVERALSKCAQKQFQGFVFGNVQEVNAT